MKIDKDEVIFLLGGRDLEMMEIKRVLDEENVRYFDNGLSWDNATLSSYKDKLNKFSIYYAVELKMDLEGYDNVEVIDHHGELSNRDASLLQVLKIVELIPTREQRLIAENDANYIDGMKSLEGTSLNDIARIRRNDRKAQGITDDEYKVGQLDIKNVVEKNEINIIKTYTDKFATITDALYFSKQEYKDRSIIYNDEKIVFYGFDIKKLRKYLSDINIEKNNYYFGKSFLGIIDKKFTKDEIEILCNNVVDKFPVLYSSHIFMFPFRFDYTEKPICSKNKKEIHEYEFYYEEGIEDRINLANIQDRLIDVNWVYEEYDTLANEKEKHLAYNEFAYFYDYAKDSIYNRETFDINAISSFFRKKDSNGNKLYEGQDFVIDINKNNDNPASIYTLKIDGVTLRVFHTGIAILSIEVENYTYPQYKDILRINDYGRRMYPQFIGKDEGSGHTSSTKESFLPNSIKIGDDDAEDFSLFKYKDIEIGKHIMQVLGTELFVDKKALIEENVKDGKFYIQPSLDDRMFVVSWYANSTLLDDISTRYTQSDKWYEYVFIDGNGVTVKNEKMKKKLLEESTYDRWSNYGALFGLTRYSFVCLTSNGYYGKQIISKHMNTMYFQMATLLLANRTSILRFSDEIAALVSPSETQRKETTPEAHVKKIENLYSIYLKYYNRLYFKEITHQDQGIELYDIGIKQMRIGNHVEKLDGKFEKLFNFENLITGKYSSQKMDNLSLLGAIFLPIGLMVSLLGLGIFEYDGVGFEHIGIVFVLLFSMIVGLLIVKPSKKTLWYMGLASILIYLVMYLFYENAGVKANASPQEVQVVQCIYDTKLKSCKGEKDVK